MAPHKYYTVGVSNQFAAFGLSGGESSDEGEVILSSPPVVESAKDSTGMPSYENKSVKKDPTPQKAPGSNNANNTRGQRPENRMNPRGGRGGANTNPRREANTETENEGLQAPRRRGGFRGRGRGNARGREFDRHSGMGKPRDNAKGGGGGHNWGKEDELQNVEAVREEIRAESTPNAVGEEALENVESVENMDESTKRDANAIDYETYKQMVSGRRANLPSFTHPQSQKQITTGKELEAQGYKVHQKEPVNRDSNTEESDDEHEGRKKKAISVYEYIQQEGGRVNMFSSRRGRGGRGGEERRSFRGGSGGGRRGGRSKDAPDIQDTRAFPSLG